MPVTVSLLAGKFAGIEVRADRERGQAWAKSETLRLHQRPYFPGISTRPDRPAPTRLCTQTLASDEVECIPSVPIFSHFYSFKTSTCRKTKLLHVWSIFFAGDSLCDFIETFKRYKIFFLGYGWSPILIRLENRHKWNLQIKTFTRIWWYLYSLSNLLLDTTGRKRKKFTLSRKK